MAHRRRAPSSCTAVRRRRTLAEAERWAADILVVGSRGHGTLAAALLGSVSNEVVDRSWIPVLVARRPHLRRLLLGTDGSSVSTHALGFLQRL